MIIHTGEANIVVISHEDFTLWDYNRFFQIHHLTERIPEEAKHHIPPLDLLQTYDLDSLRAAGYGSIYDAAVFVFDPQHSNIFEHITPQQRGCYHLSVIGESHLYGAQKREWFIHQARADFQS